MKTKTPIRYNNLLFRIGGSLFAALFITLYGTGTSLFVAMKYPTFYIAVGFSFGVGLLLTFIVHQITKHLDKTDDWMAAPYTRSLLQCLLGVLAPVMIAYCILYFYFREIMKSDIHDAQYMLVDFPHLVYFLILLNGYYIIHYLVIKVQQTDFLDLIRFESMRMEHLLPAMQSPQTTVDRDAKSDPADVCYVQEEALGTEATDPEDGGMESTAPLDIEEIGILTKLSNICFFYRQHSTNRIVFKDGHSAIVGLSLDRIEQIIADQLGEGELMPFYRINRKVLLGACALSQNSANLSIRNNLPDIVPSFLSAAKGTTPDLFRIGRSNMEGFKQWLELTK